MHVCVFCHQLFKGKHSAETQLGTAGKVEECLPHLILLLSADV